MFDAWLRAYESAGIESSSSPPGELTRSLASCALIITSPATRAIQSAERLPISAAREICADAAEAPLPWRLNCPVPLRPATFTVLARVLWRLGIARAEENVEEVRRRADKLVQLLSARAARYGHVGLVGHGYMNRFLRRALESAGWRSSDAPRSGYWSCAHFDCADVNRGLGPGMGASFDRPDHRLQFEQAKDT